MNNSAGSDSKNAVSVPLFSRFHTRLLLLVLLVFIPALALTIFTNLRQRDTQKDRIKEATIALARLTAANEANFVKNTRQLLTTVSQVSFLVHGTNRRLCEVHFINLRKLSPDYLDFGLIELNGDLFCSAAVTNGMPNLSHRSHFQRVLRAKQFSIGNFEDGGLLKQPRLDFGCPIFNERGELTRVMYASLDLALLSKVAAEAPLPDGAALTIFDSNGNVVARHPTPEKWVGKSLANEPFVQRILREGQGTYEMPDANGIEKLFAVAAISNGRDQNLFISVDIPRQVVFAEANQALLQSIVLLGLIAILALVVADLYARHSLIGPVRALAATARRLTAGQWSTRTGLGRGKGEFSDLGRALDEIAATIEKRQAEIAAADAEIRRMNAELEQRVKERTSQLEEANRELESFSYSVSHDLRAPLRHINGYAELVSQNADSTLSEDARRHLDVVTESVKRMAKLIDDLLSFSRMGRGDVRRHDVDMNQLVEEVVREISCGMAARKIQWEIGSLPEVCGDRALLKLVWTNLFSNAVKYTQNCAEAKIVVGCNQRGNEFEFFVRDNGAGFDMRYVQKLFGVFQRLHGDEEFEGTGIGLASVRRIILRHGGQTRAEGKLGEGATFYFTLPRVVVDGAAAPSEKKPI